MLRATVHKIILLVGAIVLGFTSMSPAWAEQDLRLVIDLSGSMKQNDPRSLRSESLKLFVNQLKDGDKAGVWTFAQQVNMLVPYGDVDAAWKDSAIDKVAEVHSQGQWTNIGRALETATANILASSPDSDPIQLVLITDGMVDISSNREANEAERVRILTSVIPELQQKGVVVHTIALTEKIDSGVLVRLAAETDGSFFQASSLTGLEDHFLQISSQINDDGFVPIVSNKFFVDKTSRSFTATLFKADPDAILKLNAPDGQKYQLPYSYNKVEWNQTDNYDEIKVMLPRGGLWEIEGEILPQSQVALDSDLAIKVDTQDRVVFPGDQVDVEFTITSYGQPVLEPAYLNLLKASSTIQNNLGKTQDVHTTIDKGRFKVRVALNSSSTGSHQLETTISGPDFIRQATSTIHVLDHAVLQVNKVDEHYEAFLTPVNPVIHRQNTQVIASLSNPNKGQSPVTFNWTKGGVLFANIDSEFSGKHLLNVRLQSGQGSKSIDFKLAPESLVFPEIMIAEPLPELVDDLESELSEENENQAMSDEESVLDLMNADGFMKALNELLENGSEESEESPNDVESSEEIVEEVLENIEPVTDSTELIPDEVIVKKAFVKHPIETVDIMDPGLIVVVPESVEEDLWVEEIPDEIAIENGPGISELIIWSLPALVILIGFYLFITKFSKHQRDLEKERNELEEMIKQEEEKAEEIHEEPVYEEDDAYPPYDQDAIDNAENISPEDLGKDSEHIFDDDIVSMPVLEPEVIDDPLAFEEISDDLDDEFDGSPEEGIEEDDDDVFDLGDLSDLSDDIDESEEEEKTEAR